VPIRGWVGPWVANFLSLKTWLCPQCLSQSVWFGPGAPFLNMRTLGAGCPPGPKANRILLFEPTIRIFFSDRMIASTTLER
jgi:hypothetical protein